MTGRVRPAESYVHGIEGPAAIVPGRVCAWLERYAALRAVRTDQRGVDPEVDAVLLGIATAAAIWRERQRPRSDGGTELGKDPEPDPECLTTAQAARLLGVGVRAVRKACAEGRLPAVRHGDVWSIAWEGVEHYRARRAA